MDMWTVLRRVAASQDGTVTLDQARAVGLSAHDIDQLCRTGKWRRLARTVYLVDAARFDDVPRRALIRAAVASCGPHAMAVLGTAAELHGIAGLPPDDAVHVSLPGPAARARRVRDPRVVIHQLVIPGSQVGRVAGIPATTPLRTVADLILTVGRFPAVSLLDSALNRRLVVVDDLVSLPTLLAGRRGAVAARRYVVEADGRAESPLETRIRLRCVDGRVVPDELQYAVRDLDGYLIGVGDFMWRFAGPLGSGLLGEADGAGPHGTPDALYRDRRRQNLLINLGWSILRFTWADTLQPDYIPWMVRQALATARRHPR